MRIEDVNAQMEPLQGKKLILLDALGFDLEAIPSDTNIVLHHEAGTWIEVDTGKDKTQTFPISTLTPTQKAALDALTDPAVWS